MRHVTSAILFLLFQFSILENVIAQPCNCTNCPQFMPDNFTGDFLLTVQNAANPTLGQNGQGVCGVTLYFDHEYIGDLSIVLTSPAGQSVTLVGPIGLWGPTDGTSWNVTFLPCGDPISPDPGFSGTWNNNQNWGLFGAYTGSYHPAGGCLENFNSGPVNGTWTLTVTDGQSNDVGNFYDYQIIFCDPSGILCFTCAAEAGNLTQPDVSACEGSLNLNLNLPPTFTANEPEPPASEYSYTYVIAGPGGVIQAFEDIPDLSGYLPGVYTVCGMSYYTLQSTQLPSPNGSLTIQQLSAQLNSSSPPFCGDITSNCVNVTIFQGVPNEEEYGTVCAPDCYLFINQSYCQSGTYTVNRVTANGCPYTSTLFLEVLQPSFTTLNETACENDCAQTGGFEDVCDPGQYQVKYSNAVGCDSTVTLNFNYLIVNSVIAPPPPFPCAGGTIQISGAGSTVGAGTTYLWTASNGGNIVGPASGINVQVDAPGDYQLRVCRSAAGAFCCDSTSVTVAINQNAPPAPVGISGPLPACEDSISLYTVTPVPGADSYLWTVSDSVTILSGQGTDTLRVVWAIRDSSIICVQAVNTCGTGPTFCLPAYAIGIPGQALFAGDTIVCPNDTVLYTLQTPGDSSITGFVWTVDSLGTIISGQGNDSLLVVWNQAGAGQICYGAQNLCGAGPLRCQSVQIGTLPPTPLIAGPVTACTGSTVLYTTSPVGGAFSYDWVVTGGVTVGGNGADSLIVQWGSQPSLGTICLKLVGSCGQTLPGCLTVAIGAPPALPIVAGDTLLCPGSIGNYSILPVGGATGYDWTVPAGSSILSGQNTTSIVVRWDDAPGGDICVAAVSGCGTGPQACFPVAIPVAPTANAGQDTAGCGNNGVLMAALSISGSSGVWSFLSGPGMASIASPNNETSNVIVSQSGAYEFLWTETNSICADNDTVRLEFYSIPQSANLLRICDGTNTNYTVQFDILGGTAPYLVNGDLANANQYISAPILSGQSYNFVIVDANGCSSNALTGSFNCSCATNSGSMSATLLEACPMDTVSANFNNDATLDTDDLLQFVLHTGSGTALGTILAQNTSGAFGFQPGMNFGVTYYISAVAGNALNGIPDPADPCLSVAPGQPIIFYDFPLADAGLDAAVCGDTLTLNGNTGAGSWKVITGPPGGTLTITSPSAPQSPVQASLPGQYSLSWTRSENGCFAEDTVLVQFNEFPGVNSITEVCDSASEFYTVSINIVGGTAPYTLNNQAVGASPFISAPIPSGQTYIFQIVDANGCAAPEVSGSFTCNCLTNAGTMSGVLLQACQGATVSANANPDLQLDGNDVSSYVLHSNAGNAIGQVFSQNSTGVFGWVPGMALGATYYISRIAGNDTGGVPDLLDPCLSVSAGQPVVFLAIPAPNAGVNAGFCGLQGQLTAVTSPFPGQWTLAGGPGTAIIAIPPGTSSTVNVSQAGLYRFAWTETNVICTAADTVDVQFNAIPVVSNLQEVCDSVNTAYRVIIQLAGGAMPATSTGLSGTFSNNTFTSVWIPSGSAYSFTITDINGCTTAPINGLRLCDCATNAGSMNTNLQVFCAGDTATGIWNNNGNTDANDIVRFVLHDLPGALLGNVLAISGQPAFAFGPNLQTGVTYYISAIAGNNLNGNVDISDPCFSVAPGTPVRWKALPAASLSGTTTICAGSSTNLIFGGTGDYPLTISYLDAGGAQQSIFVPGPAPVTLAVSPTGNSSYQLTQVTDGTLPGCSNNAADVATVTVSQPLLTGQALPAPAFCADTNVLIQLSSLLTGEDAGGVWAEVSATPSTGGAFNAGSGTFQTNGQQAGTFRFRYSLDAAAPCLDSAIEVAVVVHPVPVADAGQDQSLSCDDPDALIGGSSTAGAGTIYEWFLANALLPNANTAQTQVAAAGIYTLVVRNTFGCTDRDIVIVDDISTVPSAQLRVQAIQCFGDNNGLIAVESPTGGTPPLQFALNGGSFGTTQVFSNLGPGAYQITLQDAQGCEWVSDTVFLNPPSLLTADLGNDLEIQLGEAANVQLSVSVPLAALDTIVWTPLLDTLAVNQPQQQFIPLFSQRIRVEVADENGCLASDEMLVRVDRGRRVYVPNIFNPDLGGLTVYGGIDVAEIERFAIFDRWGGSVFENINFQPNNPADGWQGTQRGDPVTPGVFAWFALVKFIDGASEIFTGDVTVYR